MQTANVPQPIEYAVGLPSCRLNFAPRYKHDLSKSVFTEFCRPSIVSQAVIILLVLLLDVKEIRLFLLPVLEPFRFILNRVHIDLNLLPLVIIFFGF